MAEPAHLDDRWTEEDLKARVLLPWLQAHGIGPDELKCEESFTIQLGRHRHEVAHGFARAGARGRYDVLVRRGGRNLFIFETKAPTEAITSDDVGQAVSYARLVEPNVAPFCIVTNGRETRFIDTMTKKDVAVAGALPGATATISEELRREALGLFVGYSRENLTALCGAQVRARMRPFCETPDGRAPIFRPDLYAPRSEADGALQSFLEADARCFVAAGEAGAGKTSWLCSTAVRFLDEGRPIFFYQAHDLARGLFQELADDLNWGLTVHRETEQAARRMLDIFRDTTVLVLVDGLDLLAADVAVQVLNDFVMRAPPGIRLIATSKPAFLDRLRHRGNAPTQFALQLRRPGGDVVFDAMTHDELSQMLGRYRTVYGFVGNVDRALLDQCRRSPFLLRVAFEVAAAEGREAITQDIDGLYRAYLASRLPAGDPPDNAIGILGRVANLMVESDAELVDEQDVRQALELRPTESMPDWPFAQHILTRAGNAPGKILIGFAWSRVRDYVAAVHGKEWAKLTTDEFRALVDATAWAGLRWEALRTYYSLATAEHRRVLDEPLHGHASRLVEIYEGLLDEHFGAFKEAFEPHEPAPGRIGFLGYLTLGSANRSIGGHGFRRLRDGDEKVMLLPSVRPMEVPGFHRDEHRWAVLGVRTLRGGGRLGDLQEAPTFEAVIDDLVEPQLKEAVEKGLLDERHSRVLLTERVLPAWFRSDAGRRTRRDGRSGFPVRLIEVFADILDDLIAKQMRQQNVERGMVPQVDLGGIRVTYHAGVSDEERVARRERAKQVASASAWRIPEELNAAAARFDWAEPRVRDLRALAGLGVTEIAAPPFERPRRRLTAKELTALAARRFKLFLDEYFELVGKNFPTLAGQLRLYAIMPVTCFVEARPEVPDTVLYVCSDPQPTVNSVVPCDAGEITFDRASMTLRRAGEQFSVSRVIYTSLSPEFLPSKAFMPFDGDRGYCEIRALVYEQVREELKGVIAALPPEADRAKQPRSPSITRVFR